MFYRNELQFLLDTLRKSRIRTLISATDEASLRSVQASDAADPFGMPVLSASFVREMEEQTVYQLTDGIGLHYVCLLLPETDEPTLLLIGPYHTAVPIPGRTAELGEEQGIPSSRRRAFAEYYSSIPVLEEGDRLFVMLSTFCERIWRRPAFALVDVDRRHQVSVSPINEPLHNDRFDDVLLDMKTMENRYAFENELIRAVSLGQLHKENQLLSAFSDRSFEQRLADPLRNAKNYGVIMNTLLRKAAERGGVHPLYLNRVSSEFAAKIEQMSELSENLPLMREMFRAYCRLVRKHSLTPFSLVVQRAILLIDSDLSANLSLQSLADHQQVSPGYLSAIFRRETGKTLSEYVREKRIRHAAHLLATTHLQIQTVALHCGIMDVQYFSKTFKRLLGMTPKEYRESVRRQPQQV